VPVSGEIDKLTTAIDDLVKKVPKDLAKNCRKLENGLKDQCAEIKKQKLLVRANVQESMAVPQQTIKEIVKIIEKPIVSEKVKVVTKVIEKPIIQTKFE